MGLRDDNEWPSSNCLYIIPWLLQKGENHNASNDTEGQRNPNEASSSRAISADAKLLLVFKSSIESG